MTSPMSMRRAVRFPQIPTGEVVGSFETYERAQGAVDQLARADFPVSEVSILGSNLKSVERITGKMNAGRAALSGLFSGLFLGLFVGLIIMFLTPQVNIMTLGSIMLVAIGFSVIWNLILFALSPQKKEFTSVMQILAAHFDVVVSPTHAAQARQILGNLPVVPQAQPVAPTQTATPPTHAAPSASGPAPADVVAGATAADAPEGPTTPPRTYGEAQDALRREAEQRAREARAQHAPDAVGRSGASSPESATPNEYSGSNPYVTPTGGGYRTSSATGDDSDDSDGRSQGDGANGERA